MTDVPEDLQREPEPAAPAAVQGAVVRHRSASVARRRLPRELVAVRDRLVQVAQHPAAVAAATVATGLAVNALREVAKSGALSRRPATPVAVSGYVVHHVHVIHSVVHHHVVTSARPPVLPAPPR